MSIVVSETTKNQQQIVESALALAKHGLPVVLLHRWDEIAPDGNELGKSPVGRGWQHTATTDQLAIRYAWQNNPDANVGVRLGFGPTPIIDLECDNESATAEYEALFGSLPVPTYSGRRGRHHLFHWRTGFPDTAVFHSGAIEVRTGNGEKAAQSVFPPSRHPKGNWYTWVDGLTLDDVPLGVITDDLLATLLAAYHPAPAKTTTPLPVDTEQSIKQAQHWLAACQGTQSGMGLGCDSRVSRIAIDLVHGFALKPDVAISLLTEWGKRDDQIDQHGFPYPWTEREMQRKVSWALTQTYDGTVGDRVRFNGHELDERVEEIVTGGTMPAAVAVPPVSSTGDISDIVELEQAKQAQQPTTPPSKSRRSLHSVEELLNLPQRSWQVENVFHHNAFVVLWGESDSGKSFLALDWCLSICTGKAWLGKHAVTQGAAVYISAEGNAGFGNRIVAWCQSHNSPLPTPDVFGVIPSSFGLTEPKELVEAVKTISTMKKPPSIIVIDTLNRNLGAGSENDPKDMGAFIRAADVLRETFNCTVVIIHHTGWNNERERGFSGLRGASDTMISASRKGDALIEGMVVRCIKQKDADRFDTLVLSVEKCGSSLVLSGGEKLAQLTAAEHEQADNQLIQKLLAVLPDKPNGISVDEIEKLTGWTRRPREKAIKLAVNKMLVIQVGAGAGVKKTYYRTPGSNLFMC